MLRLLFFGNLHDTVSCKFGETRITDVYTVHTPIQSYFCLLHIDYKNYDDGLI